MWNASLHLLKGSLYFFLFYLPICCFSEALDFEALMGLDSLQYVQTREDVQRIQFFKKNFDQHIASLQTANNSERIPKILHFIWLGPKDFPLTSLEKIEKWIELHPDWTVKFWTDINRAPPLKKMKKQLVEEFSFKFLSDAYDQSDNFGEKAKVLCYEILFQEGGVYVDHDVKPCSTLDNLNQALDFYCGLEKLGPSVLSSSVYVATHLIAAKASHSILQEAIIWLSENWKRLEEIYPGQSKSAIKNRFAHRTQWALNEAIDRKLGTIGTMDIIFPASYFSHMKKSVSTIALHTHEETWTKDENDFETKMCCHFEEILSKNHESLKIVLLMSLGVLLSLIILFSFARTMRKSYEG